MTDGQPTVSIELSSETAGLLKAAAQEFGFDVDGTIRALLETTDCVIGVQDFRLPPYIENLIGQRVRDGWFIGRSEAVRHYVLLGLYAEQSSPGGCFL